MRLVWEALKNDGVPQEIQSILFDRFLGALGDELNSKIRKAVPSARYKKFYNQIAGTAKKLTELIGKQEKIKVEFTSHKGSPKAREHLFFRDSWHIFEDNPELTAILPLLDALEKKSRSVSNEFRHGGIYDIEYRSAMGTWVFGQPAPRKFRDSNSAIRRFAGGASILMKALTKNYRDSLVAEIASIAFDQADNPISPDTVRKIRTQK